MKAYRLIALAATMLVGAAAPAFAEKKADAEKKPADKQIVYRANMTGVT